MKKPQTKEWRSSEYSQQFIADYKPFNFVDGEGVRCSLYVSGCLFACKGCFNKKAQSFCYGQEYSQDLENQILKDLTHDYVQGLTLLGGEPFLNTAVCLSLVRKIRHTFGTKKDIWSWTGYTFEQLVEETEDKLELLNHLDILVDGSFDQNKIDLNLQFRGSRNQRIIDVPQSLFAKKVIWWEKVQDKHLTG